VGYSARSSVSRTSGCLNPTKLSFSSHILPLLSTSRDDRARPGHPVDVIKGFCCQNPLPGNHIPVIGEGSGGPAGVCGNSRGLCANIVCVTEARP